MKLFTDDNGNLSIGRVLSATLFLVATGYLFYAKLTSKIDIGSNDSMVIVWMYGIAIGGKALQKFSEKKK